MKDDGFYLTLQPQPGLSWQVAAVRFDQTRADFLRKVPDKPDPVGIWHSTCFPFKGYENRRITKAEAKFLRITIRIFRDVDIAKRYERVVEMEKLFREYLLYPPYDLSDNWDGNATKRRAWAELILRRRKHVYLKQ